MHTSSALSQATWGPIAQQLASGQPRIQSAGKKYSRVCSRIPGSVDGGQRGEKTPDLWLASGPRVVRLAAADATGNWNFRGLVP